jgi:regulator of protease activity HflC (stomatin/prohibitin superfamily)
MEVSCQEILTSDRVSLRINLSASYRIVDTVKVATLLSNYTEFLYREFQLALRENVGTRTLDELLVDKDALNREVENAIKARVLEYGLQLQDVGVKDIILPGDMKQILNQVVEAQKAAEANLIKRREETQATRSLQNTARVMEGNPVLLRLKELEV